MKCYGIVFVDSAQLKSGTAWKLNDDTNIFRRLMESGDFGWDLTLNRMKLINSEEKAKEEMENIISINETQAFANIKNNKKPVKYALVECELSEDNSKAKILGVKYGNSYKEPTIYFTNPLNIAAPEMAQEDPVIPEYIDGGYAAETKAGSVGPNNENIKLDISMEELKSTFENIIHRQQNTRFIRISKVIKLAGQYVDFKDVEGYKSLAAEPGLISYFDEDTDKTDYKSIVAKLKECKILDSNFFDGLQKYDNAKKVTDTLIQVKDTLSANKDKFVGAGEILDSIDVCQATYDKYKGTCKVLDSLFIICGFFIVCGFISSAVKNSFFNKGTMVSASSVFALISFVVAHGYTKFREKEKAPEKIKQWQAIIQLINLDGSFNK